MAKFENIQEHMEVLGSDGQHVGTVDHLEGADKIKLAKSDARDGKHHFISVDLIDKVDSKVHLKKAAKDVQAGWQSAA
jgi:hypothetical protein